MQQRQQIARNKKKNASPQTSATQWQWRGQGMTEWCCVPSHGRILWRHADSMGGICLRLRVFVRPFSVDAINWHEDIKAMQTPKRVLPVIPLIEKRNQFRMCKFVKLKTPRFPIHVFLKIAIPCSRSSFNWNQKNAHSCFLEVSDPIVNNFKIFKDEPQGISALVFSSKFKNDNFKHSRFPEMTFCGIRFRISLESFGFIWCLRSQEEFVLGTWTRPQIRKSWTWRVFRFSRSEIQKLLPNGAE